MTNKQLPVFTKLMMICSSIILIFLVIGAIISPFVSQKMSNTNYGLSDPVQMYLFENSLSERGIPFDKISDTTISVPQKWTDEADRVFQNYNN